MHRPTGRLACVPGCTAPLAAWPASQDAPPHWRPGSAWRRSPASGPRDKGAESVWLGASGLLRAGASQPEVCPRPVPAQVVSEALVLTQAEAMPRPPVSRIPGPFPLRSRPGPAPASTRPQPCPVLGRVSAFSLQPAYRPCKVG